MGTVIVDKKLNEAVTVFYEKNKQSGMCLKDYNIPESEAITSLHQSL